LIQQQLDRAYVGARHLEQCDHCGHERNAYNSYQNKRELYGILFRATAQTLLTIGADPKHLGAKIGFLPCSTPGALTVRDITPGNTFIVWLGSMHFLYGVFIDEARSGEIRLKVEFSFRETDRLHGLNHIIRNVISNCVYFEAMLSFRDACDND
jgi:hypothetical protein